MIAGNAERLPRLVADKDQLAVTSRRHRMYPRVLTHRVAELRHELDKLVEAAMNVSNDVEGATIDLLCYSKADDV